MVAVQAEMKTTTLDNQLAQLEVEEGAKSRARAKFEAARQARLAKESGQTAQTSHRSTVCKRSSRYTTTA